MCFYLNGAVNVNNNCIFRIKRFAVYMLLHVREIYLMFSLKIFYLHTSCKWDWTSYDNISEVRSLLQRYKQKIIVHNGDNYTNRFYNMIYLDVNNKVNIKKNKVK